MQLVKKNNLGKEDSREVGLGRMGEGQKVQAPHSTSSRGFNVWHGNYSQRCHIAYSKVAKRADLKRSYHKKKNFGTGVMDIK